MVAGISKENSPPGSVLELLSLASARPRDAMAKAREILAADSTPYDASVAHQAIGTLLREFGDLDAATRELQAALRLARMAGSTDRQGEAPSTLGVTLTYHGHSGRGLAALDSALELVAGLEAGRVLVRRGIALWRLGRHSAALDDLRRAVPIVRLDSDAIWEARALSARALVYLACGATTRADLDLSRAESLFATTSQEVEVAFTWHNRGLVAFRSGDIPRALSCLGEADRRYRLLGVSTPDLSIDRCAVLLSAGLPRDALREADVAVLGSGNGGQATKKAELLLWPPRSRRWQRSAPRRRGACSATRTGPGGRRRPRCFNCRRASRRAQRAALRAGRSRQLLAWSERWRASALAVPPA